MNHTHTDKPILIGAHLRDDHNFRLEVGMNAFNEHDELHRRWQEAFDLETAHIANDLDGDPFKGI